MLNEKGSPSCMFSSRSSEQWSAAKVQGGHTADMARSLSRQKLLASPSANHMPQSNFNWKDYPKFKGKLMLSEKHHTAGESEICT